VITEGDGQQQGVADVLVARIPVDPFCERPSPGFGERVRLAVAWALLPGLDQPVPFHGRQFAVDLTGGQRPEFADALLGRRHQVPPRLRALVQEPEQGRGGRIERASGHHRSSLDPDGERS